MLTLTGIQQVTHFTFYVTFFGMIGGAIFFAMQSQRLKGEWSVAMTLETVVCVIAALNYSYMKDLYAGTGVGIGTMPHRFPTEFRYIDWILTVPLMLTQFPTLLGMGKRGRPFLYLLVSLATLMLLTGFFGEISTDPTVHLGLLAVGTLAWFGIIGLLFYGLSELPESIDENKRGAIKRLALFVTIGWLVYPIGYLASVFQLPLDYRELVYNIGDLVNKVGLGVSVYAAGTAALHAQMRASALPELDLDEAFVRA